MGLWIYSDGPPHDNVTCPRNYFCRIHRNRPVFNHFRPSLENAEYLKKVTTSGVMDEIIQNFNSHLTWIKIFLKTILLYILNLNQNYWIEVGLVKMSWWANSWKTIKRGQKFEADIASSYKLWYIIAISMAILLSRWKLLTRDWPSEKVVTGYIL